MNVQYWWNTTDRGQLKHSREKPIPVPLHPPQIPQKLPFKPRNPWGETHNKVLMYGTQRMQFNAKGSTSV